MPRSQIAISPPFFPSTPLISLQHLNLPRPLFLHPYRRSLTLSRSSCPNLLSTPSCEPHLSDLPSSHPLLFLPTNPSAIPPSIRLSNGHQGRESPCSCLGQTLITHTVTLGWGHSHPFCTWSSPAHSPHLGESNYRSPNGRNEADHTHLGLKGEYIVLLIHNCIPTVCTFGFIARLTKYERDSY